MDESGHHDENQVVKFSATKFVQLCDGKDIKLSTPLHIYMTSALDTNVIEEKFKDITWNLIRLT